MPNPLDLFLDEINRLISINDNELALSQIKKYLDALVVDSRLHGKVFASAKLDRLCLEIGKGVFNNLPSPSNTSPDASKPSIVFVASELHLTGGHTKILQDYIKILNGNKIRVLVTDPNNMVDRQAIIDYFANLNICLEFSPAFTPLLQKLEWLLKRLILAKPTECYLFNHANDPISIAAMQPSLVPRCLFVHHCDHTLTLGMHIQASLHLDFRAQGFNNCKNNLNIDNTVRFPLTCEDQKCPPPSGRFLKGGFLRTCTTGSYKFEIPYAFSLVSELPKWLKAIGGVHTHIGELSPASINKIRAELDKLAIPQDRFRIISFTQSLWQSLIDEKIDLYIDSFPICGVRSTIEAMGAGVPIAIHHNYVTPFWFNDSVYPEARIWTEPEEFKNWLATLNPAMLEKQSQLAREFYLVHHHPTLLKTFLLNIKEKSVEQTIKSAEDYYIDPLRAFMDQFIPTVFNSTDKKASLSKLLVLLEDPNVNVDSMISYGKNYLSPFDYNTFIELIVEASHRLQAIDIINDVHPIFNDRKRIDKQMLSELLYQIGTTKKFHSKNRINLKTKVKLLYQRIKLKYCRQ